MQLTVVWVGSIAETCQAPADLFLFCFCFCVVLFLTCPFSLWGKRLCCLPPSRASTEHGPVCQESSHAWELRGQHSLVTGALPAGWGGRKSWAAPPRTGQQWLLPPCRAPEWLHSPPGHSPSKPLFPISPLLDFICLPFALPLPKKVSFIILQNSWNFFYSQERRHPVNQEIHLTVSWLLLSHFEAHSQFFKCIRIKDHSWIPSTPLLIIEAGQRPHAPFFKQGLCHGALAQSFPQSFGLCLLNSKRWLCPGKSSCWLPLVLQCEQSGNYTEPAWHCMEECGQGLRELVTRALCVLCWPHW